MPFISKSTYDPYGEYKHKVTDDLLTHIKKEYGLDFDNKSAKDLGGSYSRNILLPTDKGKYVARVYQAYVTIARLVDVQNTRKYLNANGVPTTRVIPTLQGKNYSDHNCMLIEVEEYLPIKTMEKMNTWDKIEIGVEVLAKIHNLLSNFEVSNIGRNPLVANHVEVEYALQWTQRGIESLLADDPSDFDRKFADDAIKLAQFISETQPEVYLDLPRCLTHGDFWDNNVFLKEGTVRHVIDFDFMGKRARIDDIAYTLYAMIGGTYSRQHVDNIKEVLKRYNSKLDTPLNEKELKSLPLSMARIPLAFIGIIASLDTREQMANEAKNRVNAVTWALKIMEDIRYWQEEVSQL
jgi:homoserine kinase type II